MTRTYNVRACRTAQNTPAFTYDGFEGGICVMQGRKLWRERRDAERAAKKWSKA